MRYKWKNNRNSDVSPICDSLQNKIPKSIQIKSFVDNIHFNVSIQYKSYKLKSRNQISDRFFFYFSTWIWISKLISVKILFYKALLTKYTLCSLSLKRYFYYTYLNCEFLSRHVNFRQICKLQWVKLVFLILTIFSFKFDT